VETEAPALVTVLDKTAVEQQAGVNLDDRLRSVPGFSLFRRSSSLVANPTTQGVSLRGLGSSGASRTLVLWDGVPLNDPFGGWVYWTMIAPEDLERVEIINGAATSAFGDRAMSGAIALFSRPLERFRLSGAYEGGNLNSHSLSGGFSQLLNRWGVSVNTRAFTTDGYFIVPSYARGPADRPANVSFITGDLRTDYIGSADHLFLKLDILAEERQNGTVLTNNSTGLGTIAANYAHEWTKDSFSILGYHTREQYHSSFSSVTQNRSVERITFLQTVPSEAVGADALWRRTASRWNLLAGADVQRVEGTSVDHLFPSGLRTGGGSQLQHGVFGQLDFTAGPARFFAGARHQFTGANDTFFSPNAGVAIGRGRLRARGSVYRSFRAPTLNELYREFRVGNTDTQANPLLRQESLFGAEAGLDFGGELSRISVTFYRHSLGDLITNVTLSSTPALIVRQRRNAASALARGIDFEAHRNWGRLRAEAGYLFADSRYVTGARIPQVPKHQGSAQLTYLSGGTLLSAGLRSYGAQFEDDVNQFRLPGFAALQISARQRLTKNLSASVAVENLLNRQYLVGFSPTPLIGSPRLWRAGLRWEGQIGKP
jgi:outer membrane receptor protein involved in Fe transport